MDLSPSLSAGRSSTDSPTYLTTSTSSISDAAGLQSLSSILNNPHGSKSSDLFSAFWPPPAAAPPDFAPLTRSSSSDPPISRSHFLPYLSLISEPYQRFEDVRNHETKEEGGGLGGGEGVSGEALVACLREVPALYFKEDFALEDGPTFRAACPFSNIAENSALQEKLSQYLDVVELHLVKEISLRSNSFFEAQGQLQDLDGKIVEGCKWIRELKEAVRLLDRDLVESARRIRELNATRGNLVALQQKLRLILYVNQSLSALKLLVASADCAGALDVIDDLQHLLDGDELTGLHCFRHLRDHVAASIDSINSILSAEFMRASIHDAGVTDAIILSKAKATTVIYANGNDDEVKLDEEEALNFRDRLLPVVVGLLRTAKLPSVLRIYRDTLTADMKTAIKTAVAELLPILVAQPMETDFTPGERTSDVDGGNSLASKLRSLSSESFVQLLSTIFKIVRAHVTRAAEVKRAIEWIMCNLDGHYAADSVAAAIAVGAAAAEIAQDNDGRVAPLLTFSPQSAHKVPPQVKANDAAGFSNMSRNFRADVLRENAEAVFAACDAAHQRWAKLLGVRALLHPRLKLQEFLSIYSITHEFIGATEKIGGRLGYSIRGTVRSHAKAFVDFQHEMRMTKIKAVLDQETWVEVDVPDEFQVIVASMFFSEPPTSGDLDDHQATRTGDGKMVASEDGRPMDNTELQNDEKQLVKTNSSDIPLENANQLDSSMPESTESKKVDSNISTHGNHNSVKEHGKSTSHMLYCGGVGYHMVNWYLN